MRKKYKGNKIEKNNGKKLKKLKKQLKINKLFYMIL